MVELDKAWALAKQRPADAIGLAVTLCFVAASTTTGLVFAWDESQTMPRALTGAMLVAIVGGELFKALFLPLTWGRGKWGRMLFGLPILAVCIFYSLTANNKTMERYFGKHEFATVVESAGYKTAKADVDELKDRLLPLAKTRPTGTVKAELEGKLAAPGLAGCAGEMDDWRKRTYCPDIAKLRAELADSAERDKLDARLAIARTKLDAYEGQAPKASSLGPITPAFAALGLVVTTPQEALSVVFIALTELGSLFGGAVFVGGVPLALPLQDGTRGSEIASPEAISAGMATDHGDERINQVAAFFGGRCERRHGASLKATIAWQAFLGWCEETRQEPLVGQNQFWQLAGAKLNFPKRNITSGEGRGMHYINMALKKPQERMAAKIIQLYRAPRTPLARPS